ncbi:hypothetical protein [Paradevosia shaoguanensis]|uniref:hypothetical protein n=1 Tax=Paradevosia shaoguanensis TaxID=1335043 RepID=UPI0019319122|nr:hypothetical protein [Paradevosia shaoguanensis]
MTSTAYHYPGKVRLARDDHALWKLVRKRVEQKRSWEQIAAEVGCEAMELVEWVNWLYTPPPEAKPKDTISYAGVKIVDPGVRSDSESARRFAAWKRQHDGAAKTLAGRS